MIGNNFLLWENDDLVIKTPFNPHTSYEEGMHLIVTTKVGPETAWEDPNLTVDAFRVAAKACKIIEEIGMSPWFNLQANGNWACCPVPKNSFMFTSTVATKPKLGASQLRSLKHQRPIRTIRCRKPIAKS